MNHEPIQHEPDMSNKPMPKLVELCLTNRLPCALLVLLMLTSSYWLNVLFSSIPLFGFLMVLVGMLLMMAVPTVFALVLFGGGLRFTLQVAGIVAVVILILSSGSIAMVLGFLGLFVVLPVLSALLMQREQGFSPSAWVLAVGLTCFTLLGMWFFAHTGMKELMLQILTPMFDNMKAAIPAGETAALVSIQELKDVMAVVFPSLVVFSVWMTWWGDILLARKLAQRYGFYRGDTSVMLEIQLPKQWVYALGVCIALAAMTSGDMAYIATNTVLVMAGLLAVQGIAVAHLWLKSRGMMNTIVVMYVMLFFWSAVVVFFMLVGLFDVWFNYRRNMVSAIGDK